MEKCSDSNNGDSDVEILDSLCLHTNFILCIDPGEVNMGTVKGCLACLEAVEMERVNLRPFVRGQDDLKRRLSTKEMKLAAQRWIRSRDDLFGREKGAYHVYAEDQIGAGKRKNPLMETLQTILEGVLGEDRITIVSPNTVKSYFSSYFVLNDPELDEVAMAESENRKVRKKKRKRTRGRDPFSSEDNQQYRQNKQSAESTAFLFFSPAELRLANAISGKIDDVADAWWIMKYIFACMTGKKPHLTDRKKKKKTRACLRNAEKKADEIRKTTPQS